ncbi:MAG: hypothetical protein IJY52_04575 [Anaerotignum sp.]|nr:hypothetical protein [Anaerotignum sp.]
MGILVLLILIYICVSIYLHYEKRFDRLEKMIEELKQEKAQLIEEKTDETENIDG